VVVGRIADPLPISWSACIHFSKTSGCHRWENVARADRTGKSRIVHDEMLI
jgi:hypothetical protein